MSKTLMTITGSFALAGLLVLPAPTRAADAARGQVALEREAAGLVERTEEVGRELRFHADRLQILGGHPETSPWSHYHHLERVKHLVNTDLQPALVRLRAIQGQLPEWKQETVTRMIAAAQLLSADASSAFLTKRDSLRRPVVLNEAYKQFVAEMAIHAADLVTTADLAHQYASLRLRAAEVGLPTN